MPTPFDFLSNTYNQSIQDQKATLASMADKLTGASKKEEPWTTRRVLGNIYTLYQTDPKRAQKMYNDLMYLQTDRTSKYYNPYAVASNRSVSALSSYGIDTSNIDDNFFKKNDYLRNYLIYNGTTNTPSKPGAKATAQQKAAYEYYQIWKSEDATRRAENEWEQLQNEIKYWARDKNRNLTDEEILAKIDWSKYKELESMDNSKLFEPNEYNRAIGYSRDALYGAIWAARQDNYNGSMLDAIANSYLGSGKQWTFNPEVTAKLDSGNLETYSPYSVGSTMEEEGLYFGVYKFDQQWIDEHRSEILNGSDEKAKQYFSRIVDAVEYTDKLNTELSDMRSKIDELINSSGKPNAEWIANTVHNMSEYKDLFDLDDTLKKGPNALKATSDKVNYRWQDIKAEIDRKCAEKNSRAGAEELTNEFIGVDGPDLLEPSAPSVEPAKPKTASREDVVASSIGLVASDIQIPETTEQPSAPVQEQKTKAPELKPLSPASFSPKKPVLTQNESAIEAGKIKDLNDVDGTVQTFGTPVEKAAMSTGKTSYFDQCVARITESDGDFVTSLREKSEDKIRKKYANNYSVVSEYEGHQSNYDELTSRLESINSEFKTLSEKQQAVTVPEEMWPIEFERLTSLVNSTDKEWLEHKAVLENGNAEGSNREQYDAALEYLYQAVRPDDYWYATEDALAEGEKWWGYLKNGDQMFMTEEDQARMDELRRLSQSVGEQLTEEKEWIDSNKEEYNTAKQNLAFDENLYEQSVKLYGGDADPYFYSKIRYTIDASKVKTPTSYVPYLESDYRVLNDGMSREDATGVVTTSTISAISEYQTLKETYESLVASGVEFDEQSRKNIESRMKNLERQYVVSAPAMLDTISDFDATVNEQIEAYKNKTGKFDFVDAMLANYLITGKIGFGTGDMVPREYESIDAISPEETRRYFYLKAKSGTAVADQYMRALCDPENGMLTVRKAMNLQEQMHEFASQPGLNPYIATGLGLAASIYEAPSSWLYRAGQAIKGEEVSPYNSAFLPMIFKQAAFQGSKEAVTTSCDKLFGKGNAISGILNKFYDIGTGAGELAISSWMSGGAFEALGVPLSEATSGLTSAGVGTKVLKTSAEVLYSTETSAEEKYRSVLMSTNDEEKAGKMYAVTLFSGLLTHSVIMSGLHDSYKANPTEVTSGLKRLFQRVISSDAKVGASSLVSGMIDEYVDKYVMEEDSKWQADFDRFNKELGYPRELSAQLADQAMWQRISDRTWEAVVNSTIRTVGMEAAGFIGGKIDDTWDKVKKFAKEEFAVGDLKHYITDDNGNRISIEEIIESGAFEKKAAGYNVATGEITDPDGRVIGKVPKGAIPSEYGETIMIDRQTKQPFTAIAYVVDPDTNDVTFVTSKGTLVPFNNVAGTFLNTVIDDGAVPGYKMGREYALLDEADRTAKTYASENYYIGEQAPQIPNEIRLEGNEYAIGEAREAWTPANVAGSPVIPSVNSEEATAGDGRILALPAGNQPQDQAKTLQLVGGMFDADQTGASVGLTSILNTGNAEADKAAARSIISNMSYGNPKTVAVAMAQVEQSAYDQKEVNDAITFAALTNGNANGALKTIIGKAGLGEKITDTDVRDLIVGAREDRRSDPKGFNEYMKNQIKEFRVADKTNQILAQNKAPIKSAEKEVKRAEATLADKQQEKAEAEENLEAARGTAVAMIENFQANPASGSAKAELQRSTNQLEGADNLLREKEKEVEIQERKVEEAKKELSDVSTDALTAAREEATATVTDEQEAEEKVAFDNAVVALAPTVPFTKSVPVYDSDGKPVNITGVYDRVETGESYVVGVARQDETGGNTVLRDGHILRDNVDYGHADVVYVYTTEDGRLVAEYPPQKSGEEITRRGSVSTGDVDDEDADIIMDATDKMIGDAVGGGRNKHPKIAPAVYFPSSFPVNVNGKDVQMIGFAGKTISDGEEVPVIMGLDGNLYSESDGNFAIPFDYYDDVDEFFSEAADDLAEIEENQITKTTEGNVNVGEERQEDGGPVSVPVQGNGGEGNNQEELVAPSGSDDGLRDNGNAEPPAAQAEVGRGEEGATEPDGQAKGGISPGLRGLIDRRLSSKGATNLNLQEADYGRFSSSLDEARESSPYGLFVDPQSVEDLTRKGAIVYLSNDGMAGVAVGTKGEEAGNIFGVFKNRNSDAEQAAASLVIYAIANGGNKLDCYDGKLRSLYASVGMIPVARVPWNDAYHREIDENTGEVIWDDGWNYERDGRPDVIVWMHCGHDAATVAQRYGYAEAAGGYHVFSDEDMIKLPVFDDVKDKDGKIIEYGYDRALAYRDDLLKGGYYTEDDLAVTHTLSVDNAIKTLTNGGFPAPSLAVYKKGNDPGTSDYVDEGLPVTVVFKPSTIDPENPQNVVYGRDGGTVVFPEEFETTENGLVWAESGNPASLEDVVRIMLKEGDTVDAKDRTYSSLDEVIKDIGRVVDTNARAMRDKDALQEHSTIYQETVAVRNDIANLFVKNGYSEEDAKDAATEITMYYTKCKSFDEARDNIVADGITINSELGELLDRLEDAYTTAGRLLTRYMEAKPYRVVGLDETSLWIIPEGEVALEDLLRKNGLSYVTISDTDEIAGVIDSLRNVAKNAEINSAPFDGTKSVIAQSEEGGKGATPTAEENKPQTLSTGDDATDYAARRVMLNLAFGVEDTVDSAVSQMLSLGYDNEELGNAITESALLRSGGGFAALKDIFDKTSHGEEITRDDVNALLDGHEADIAKNPERNKKLMQSTIDDFPIKQAAEQRVTPTTVTEQPAEPVAPVTPTNVETPQADYEITGMDRIVEMFGLAGAPQADGSLMLFDQSGKMFGLAHEDKDGNTRVSILSGSDYDTEGVRDMLETEGFEYDPSTGEWVLSEAPQEEPVTPTTVNPANVSNPAPVENPASSENEPSQSVTPTNVNGPLRQWNTQGAQETNLLHKKVKQHILETAVYDDVENEKLIDDALTWIDSHASEKDPTGFWAATNEALSEDFDKMSAEGQARTLALLTMAAQEGHVDAEAQLSDLYAESGTDLGQALQFRRMYRLMTPQGRERALVNEKNRIEKEYIARGKKGLKLNISKETLEKAKNAKTEEEFKEARQQMEKELADQIPSDYRLRMRTWRMAAMLANPRTHIRNMEGNTVFKLPVAIKNATGAILEKALRVPVGERTKSIVKDKGAVAYAKKAVDEYMDILQGTQKYFEGLSAVERNRKAMGSGNGKTAFGRLISRTVGRGVQWAADKNSELLEKEDKLALAPAFVNALAQYMTANGYTEADMKGKVKETGVAYAILEAQKATYRDPNKTARWLSDPSNKPDWLQFGINAILPFTKTPMNIVKRGVEYSPVGLAHSLLTYKRKVENYRDWEKSGFKGEKPKGAASPGEAIDAISSGMTGTMLAGLGYLLAKLGYLTIKPTEGQKRKGVQEYSMNLFGYNVGVGNMVPSMLPVLLGGSVYEEAKKLKQGDADVGSIMQAIGNMAQPTLETTMFMSLTGMLETSKYSQYGDVTASTFLQKLLANYSSSFVPSILGATAKVVDPTKRKSYTMSGDSMQIWNQLREQTENKIPFLSKNNVPYLNNWGEEETTSRAMAFLENFILPDRINEIKDNELDDILDNITNTTGNNVNPDTKAKTLSINGEKMRLTDQQWYKYHSTRLQLAKSKLQELINSPDFIGLLDPNNPNEGLGVQAKLIESVYRYANAVAAKEVFPDKKYDTWTLDAINADNKGNLIDYIFSKEEDSARNKSNSTHREKLYLAIEQNNKEAAMVDIDMLHEGGVEDKNIRSSVTKKIKPLYQEAFKEGDYEEMERIRDFLVGLDIGYKPDTITSWATKGIDSDAMDEATEEYKPEYLKAYKKGDQDELMRIEEELKSMGIGFTDKTFINWLTK